MACHRTKEQGAPGTVDFSFRAELSTVAAEANKGRRTRAAIQVAVCDCLETAALAELTVAKICGAANVSHGTLYIYFANRNDLLAELLLRFSEFVQARMRQASKNAPDNPVRAATSAYVGLFEQNLGLMKCLQRQLDGFPQARAAFQTLNREWLESVVASRARQLRSAGSPVCHDELMRRAYALGGMTDQYLAGLLLDHDPYMQGFSQDREAIIDTLDLLWERGMQP